MRISNCGKQVLVHLADRTCAFRTVYVACGEVIRAVVAVRCSPHPLRPRRQRRHPVPQPQVDEHCLVSHDLHSLSSRLIPRMTCSESGSDELRDDRRSGVHAESERFGQLPSNVDQVLPECVLHPVWPPMRSGVVLELGNHDERIMSAVVTRPVIREHRAASLPGGIITPRLQSPVQHLVPGGIRLGVHQQADVAMYVGSNTTVFGSVPGSKRRLSSIRSSRSGISQECTSSG